MMRWYRALLRLYPASFRAEYGEEMQDLFALRLQDARGAPARLALALDALGDVVANAAAAHWDILKQDLVYTTRTLRRAPGFTLTAIFVVALGVGANTAAFSVANFVLLQPLPFPGQDRLVKLWEHSDGYSRMELSPANYRDWKEAATSFSSMGAWFLISANLVGQGEPARLDGAAVTADLLPILGIRPALGRLFTPDEDREGASGTLVLSHGLWQGQFGGDVGVVGKRVLLDGIPYLVIGVMPAGFCFPNRDIAFWKPLQLRAGDYEDRNDNYLDVLAQLRPEVKLEAARADLGVITARLEQQYPKEDEHIGATIYQLRDDFSRQSRLLLLALCGAALCILLIACANLANLLLARALARQRELAVRAALGAGSERLVRQLGTESVLLALAGGAAGLLVAIAAMPLLSRLIPRTLPIAAGPTIDLRILLFAGLLTGVTGLGFGVVPALRAGTGRELSGLREGTRGGAGRKQRLRSALVITEVMASVVLLISSGLLLRALWRLQSLDPGFSTGNLLTLRTTLPLPKYQATARRVEFYSRVLSEVRALPGVEGAAYISYLPMAMGGGIWPVIMNGEPERREADHTASLRFVTPGFFQTLQIPLRRGREIDERDTGESQYVALVSESFVRRYWPDQAPLGRHFTFGLSDRMVVGVVGDIRVRGFETTSEPQVYLPSTQVPDGSLIGYTPKDLVVRSSSLESLLPAITAIVRRADPEQPISNVRTMAEIVADQTASRSVQLRVLGALALIALLLAGVGIHGLLSYSVSTRAPEIGVRMALGAASADIVSMVVKQGVLLAAAGVIPGIALAYAAGRVMESLLASVKPGDAVTFASVIAVCLVMTTVGCLVPAWRATRVDPSSVIRAE